MPDRAFRWMKLFFRVYYFLKPVKSYADTFGIRPGYTVIDFGCGPGDYLRYVAGLVGKEGLVYAVDIHKLAIESVEKLIRKHSLTNVRPVLSDGNHVAIPDHSADLIYALDMFHMIKDPNNFLRELCRILKPDGVLVLEDGHQPRILTKNKILESGCWTIPEEKKRNLRCRTVNVGQGTGSRGR